MRKHGWQRPLHMLQLLGMGIYVILVLAYYLLLASFLGNTYLQTTATALFSFLAFSVMVLFLRCSSINPIDKTCSMKRWKVEEGNGDQLHLHLPSFLTPGPNVDATLTFCSFCNRKVKKHSKHCRSCDKCVDGFDHHCRWLNNCVGRRNYSTFMLLMASVLIMLLVEGGAGVVGFVRCFAKERGIMHEAEIMYGHRFPRWAFAFLLLFITLLSAYASAAIGQLFFFHIVLIKKGIGTYDYLLTMREDFFLDESDFLSTPSSPSYSIESSDDNHKTSNFFAKLSCLSKRREVQSEFAIRNANINLNPWRVMKLSQKEVEEAVEKRKVLRPLPQEKKCGPVINMNVNADEMPLLMKRLFRERTSLSLPEFSSTSIAASPRATITSKSLSFTNFHLSPLPNPLDL